MFSLDNFVRTSLSADAAAADDTLTLVAAAAPYNDPPDASESEPGVLVLMDTPSSPTKIEIVTYTGRTVDGGTVTLTGVTRGVENTTAPTTWPAGTPVYQGITAGALAGVVDSVPTIEVTDTVPSDVGGTTNGHMWLVV